MIKKSLTLTSRKRKAPPSEVMSQTTGLQGIAPKVLVVHHTTYYKLQTTTAECKRFRLKLAGCEKKQQLV